MPRWAFIALLAGGVILGLYLRSRRQERRIAGTEDGSMILTEDQLTTSGDPGLAGVGVVSPPGGVIPVTSPVVPEGIAEIVGVLGNIATFQGEALAAIPNAISQQPPAVNVVLPTGGGPPKTPPKKVSVKPGSHVNTNKGNPRAGQTFTTKKAKGGEWHIYKSGKKVFVKK